MEFPRVVSSYAIDNRRTGYDLELIMGVQIKVTTTASMAGARDWIRSVRNLQQDHVYNLQVGIALEGDNPDVVTLSLGNKSLICGSPRIRNGEFNKSCLANFLSRPNYRFVSCGDLNLGNLGLHLGAYTNAYTLHRVHGVNATFHQLADLVLAELVLADNNFIIDPAIEAGNWANWPLTNEQICVTVAKSHVSYLAAVHFQ